jgi:hypothetical protein
MYPGIFGSEYIFRLEMWLSKNGNVKIIFVIKLYVMLTVGFI